ncbi:hypothetical protein N0V86_006963 [Didymella sp. IMI 355093]|nr:hypothetical protein N0V86_006963 [Didymella sp. IMI 355093]
MLISKLALIAALSLTAAAYPAGRPDDSGSMSLPSGSTSSTSSQGPGKYDSSGSYSQTGQRRPKTSNSKRDSLHPPQTNPSSSSGPQRVGKGGNGTPDSPSRLPPGARLPSDGQPRQYSKRHEGHDSEPPQGSPPGPPSNPSSKPDRTGPPYGDYSDAPKRPDRNQPGRIKGDHHEHDHLRDHDKPGKNDEGKGSKGGKDQPSGRPPRPDEASPTSKPSNTATSTSMPSKSADSAALGGPTPTASLKPEASSGSDY